MLRSKRLSLRPLTPKDADWIYKGISNPNITRWLTAPPWPYSMDHAHGYLRAVAGKPHTLAIVVDRPVGVVTLHPDTEASLGFWLDQSAWGQGYMTEAVDAILIHHFQTSDLTVISGWLSGNDGSANVHQKLGFRTVSDATEFSNFYNKNKRLHRVSMTADEHAARKHREGSNP